jgi:hypothetical protein
MVSSAKRVRRTMGREETTRGTPELLANDRFRIGGPAGQRDEAAVHVEGRAWARAAVSGGRDELDFCVVELERFACA